MYFWHTDKLVYDIKNNHLSLSDTIAYALLLTISFILSINVIQLLPRLYKVIFRQVRTYLEQQAAPAPLFVNVYRYMDEKFLLLNVMVFLVGIIYCFFLHKGTIKQFVQRFITLSWPICFRIMLTTALLFLLGITLLGIYFGYKFSLLGKTATPEASPIIVKPFKFVFKVAGMLPFAKAVWTQAYLLPKAQAIFNQLNRVSYGVYWIAQIGSFFSTIWWMLTAQEKLRDLKKLKDYFPTQNR